MRQIGLCLAVLGWVAAGPASAQEQSAEEILYVPPPEVDFPMPKNSMTTQVVRNKFGEPRQEMEAVGKPPITRWNYGDYIVYFEWDKVITSVPADL